MKHILLQTVKLHILPVLTVLFLVLSASASFSDSLTVTRYSAGLPLQTLQAVSDAPFEVSRTNQELTTNGTILQLLGTVSSETILFHLLAVVLYLSALISLFILLAYCRDIRHSSALRSACGRIARYLHRKDGKKRCTSFFSD